MLRTTACVVGVCQGLTAAHAAAVCVPCAYSRRLKDRRAVNTGSRRLFKDDSTIWTPAMCVCVGDDLKILQYETCGCQHLLNFLVKELRLITAKHTFCGD